MAAAKRQPIASDPKPVATDAALIARILRGDPLAERALFDRHVDGVYRIAFRISGDSDDAADCVQETFLRAFRNLAQYRGDAPFALWLRAIALKVVFTHSRRQGRFAGTDDASLIADERSESFHAHVGLSTRVEMTLDQMSDKLRAVFLLYDIEGYSHDEIASALGIPVGTSKARLSAARGLLRAALKDFTGGS